MSNIAERIVTLFFAERAACPICKLARLINIAFQDALDQVVIRNTVPEAQSHGGDLRIENWAGWVSDQSIENLHILPGRVKDFNSALLRNQVEKGADVQVIMHRINQRLASRSGCLHKTELRPVS